MYIFDVNVLVQAIVKILDFKCLIEITPSCRNLIHIVCVSQDQLSLFQKTIHVHILKKDQAPLTGLFILLSIAGEREVISLDKLESVREVLICLKRGI